MAGWMLCGVTFHCSGGIQIFRSCERVRCIPSGLILLRMVGSCSLVLH